MVVIIRSSSLLGPAALHRHGARRVVVVQITYGHMTSAVKKASVHTTVGDQPESNARPGIVAGRDQFGVIEAAAHFDNRPPDPKSD